MKTDNTSSEIPVDGTINGISLQRKEARRKIGEEERYQEVWKRMDEENRETRKHRSIVNLQFLGIKFATCNAVRFKHCPKRSYFEFTFDKGDPTEWKKRITFQKMEGLVGYDLTNQLCFIVEKEPLKTRRWFYDNVLPGFSKEGNGGPVERP